MSNIPIINPPQSWQPPNFKQVRALFPCQHMTPEEINADPKAFWRQSAEFMTLHANDKIRSGDLIGAALCLGRVKSCYEHLTGIPCDEETIHDLSSKVDALGYMRKEQEESRDAYEEEVRASFASELKSLANWKLIAKWSWAAWVAVLIFHYFVLG